MNPKHQTLSLSVSALCSMSGEDLGLRFYGLGCGPI